MSNPRPTSRKSLSFNLSSAIGLIRSRTSHSYFAPEDDSSPNPSCGLQLPQELLDRIIDQLHEDRAMLRTCSLIGHRWRRHAQLYLFHTVSPWNRTSVDALAEIVDRSPHIASAIRILVLRFQPEVAVMTEDETTTTADDASWYQSLFHSNRRNRQLILDTSWFAHAFLQLGPRLTGVTTLSLSNWVVPSQSALGRIESHLSSGFPSLSDLRFARVFFDNLNDLFSALETRPGLTRLTLDFTNVHMRLINADTRLFMPRLEYLDIGPDNVTKDVVPALLRSPEGLRHLRTLKINVISSTDSVQAVGQLLQAASLHLQSVWLSLSHALLGETLASTLQALNFYVQG
jgi:hypothetical protein